MYNVFDKENENESDDITAITQPAALTAAPSNTSTSKGTATNAEVAAAINHLSANQTTMMAQMAVMTMAPPTAPHTRAFVPWETFHVPPIPQVAVPMHQPFTAQGSFSTGRDGHRLGHDQGRGRRGGQSCTPFADAMRSTGTVARRRHRTAPSSPRGTITTPQRRVFGHLQTTEQLECVLQLQV